MQRQQPGAIGADAEERGMAERHDAGIAEDQIERQREQRQPHDVGHDQIARGKQRTRRPAPGARTRSRSSASARAAWHDIRHRLARSSSASTRRGAAEQAVRTPDQDHDHDGVDHERAHLRHVIFAGDVADAEQQRGEERPGDAGGAADRHHDQEVDHEFQRKIRIEPEDLRAQRAAEAGKAAAEREGEGEHLRHVDAEPAGGARIVDRRAQPAAEPRARQHQLQARGQQAADHDDHQPVAADADAEEIELSFQRRRQLDEDPRRSHDVVDRRDRHEDEADARTAPDRDGFGVEMAVERPLQHRADQRRWRQTPAAARRRTASRIG